MIFEFLRSYLFSKRAHSHIKKMAWISLIGIFLGSFSLILVLSIMSGLNNATEERLLRYEPHIVIEAKDAGEFLKLADGQSLKDLKSFNSFESQDVLIKTQDGFFNAAEASGLSLDSLKKKKSFYDSYNDFALYDEDSFLKGESVLIGPDLAFELKLVVGDTIEVYKPESILSSQTQFDSLSAKSLLVAGILSADAGTKDSRLIVYNKEKLFGDTSKSLVKGYELYLHNPKSLRPVTSKLSALGLKFQTWRDRNSSLFLALKLEKLAMTFLLGLALVITSFSIMSLLILIVVQKRKDIGILMSMGLSKNRLRLLFGGMGSLLSLIGIGAGILIGGFLSLMLDLYPLKILPPIYQDPYLPADFDITTNLAVAFFCVLVAILSSLVPVFYLSKVSPVESLKG